MRGTGCLGETIVCLFSPELFSVPANRPVSSSPTQAPQPPPLEAAMTLMPVAFPPSFPLQMVLPMAAAASIAAGTASQPLRPTCQCNQFD